MFVFAARLMTAFMFGMFIVIMLVSAAVVEIGIDRALGRHGDHFAVRTAVDAERIERSIQLWIARHVMRGK